MMMSLFSIFDPSSYFGFSLNWLAVFLIFFCFPNKLFHVDSVCQSGLFGLFSSMNLMFKDISESHYLGMTFVAVTTFIFLGVSNLMSLFPFFFCFTSHPIITMGLGFILWASFFMMGWLKNFKNSAGHLVPEGSPIYLAPVMVVIEIISHLMRPFTLAIRLAANMMAGHLVVSLLSSISTLNMFMFINSFLFQSILLILEIGVCVIQGFVFSILLLLYGLEYY